MSGDEFAIAFVSLFPAAGIWVPWFLRLATVRTVTSRGSGHALLGVMPIVCLALLFGVLKAWASHDVRKDVVYLSFYFTQRRGGRRGMNEEQLEAWLGVLCASA